MFDVFPFFTYFIFYMTFMGCTFYMLQLNSVFDKENSIIPKITGVSLVDTFLNQYLLILGEYHLEGYELHDQEWLCYLLFIIQTYVI